MWAGIKIFLVPVLMIKIFKKIWRGICTGNYKKIRRGDVDREIKNISGKYEY